jgi:NADPH2 dehydrogenase
VTSNVFSPFTLRDLTVRNRIVMSPMLMYAAAEDGLLNEQLLVHYGARALGGVGMIVTEVLAVEARGRISAKDLGLWNDRQGSELTRLVYFVQSCGVKICAQLAHAGRKSALRDTAIAPSALAYDDSFGIPTAMTQEDIAAVLEAYRLATIRADASGFDALQLHAANGYLLHEFLTPVANARTDAYGGTLGNRARLLLEVVATVRAHWPAGKPVFVRLCANDFLAGGLTEDDAVTVSQWLRDAGVDLVDATTGNILPGYPGPVFPGYQVGYAEKIRAATGLAVATSGSIASLDLMEEIIGAGRVDLVFMGRALLRNPFWAIDAARSADVTLELPIQTYARATGPFERGY